MQYPASIERILDQVEADRRVQNRRSQLDVAEVEDLSAWVVGVRAIREELEARGASIPLSTLKWRLARGGVPHVQRVMDGRWALRRSKVLDVANKMEASFRHASKSVDAG